MTRSESTRIRPLYISINCSRKLWRWELCSSGKAHSRKVDLLETSWLEVSLVRLACFGRRTKSRVARVSFPCASSRNYAPSNSSVATNLRIFNTQGRALEPPTVQYVCRTASQPESRVEGPFPKVQGGKYLLILPRDEEKLWQ